MPNIREFEAPEGTGLRPSEAGYDARLQAARRVGSFYNQAGDAETATGARVAGAIRDVGDAAVSYEDHREISAGAARGTQMMADATKQWQKIISDPKLDPNDPSIQKKFLTDYLEPALEKFQGEFNTENSQKYALQFADNFRNQMFKETTADMGSLAKAAVSRNLDTSLNSLGTMVAANPASLDDALKAYRHSTEAIVGSSPTLDATTKAAVRGEIGLKGEEALVKAAVSSMIAKNPDTDLSAIEKKYSQYLKPGEVQQFQKAAQAQAKVNAYYDKQAAILQKQQADLKVHTDATKTINENMSVDAQTGKITIKPGFFKDALDIARKNPDAPSAAATARTMIDFGESQQKRTSEPADNPAVVSELSSRLFDPDHPLTANDLMRASTKGDISDHTYTKLNGMMKELESTPLKGPVYQDTMKAAHSTLVLTGVGIPGKDDAGERNYAKFIQSFVPQYLAKSRAGTLEPNALDIKDPNSMISKAMEPFRRTLTERINDYLSVLGGVTAPGVAPKAAEAAQPPRISTKADYDKLEVGTVYISAKDGQRYEKR